MAKATPPDILYKFFPSKREDFFINPSLRFTPIKELNDPFESNIVLNSNFYDNNFQLQIQNMLNGLINSFTDPGILSLTDNLENLLMWSHYASDHTGFVIGFNSRHDFFKNVDSVEYSSSRMNYDEIRDSSRLKRSLLYRNVFRKSIDWSYEREWRIFKTWIHKSESIDPEIVGLVNCPLEMIKAIYLGAMAPESLCEKAKNFCLANPEVEIYKARLHQNKYALEFVPLQL